MDRNTIYRQLEDIFMDVFDLDEVILDDSTTADDIEEWDSLSHVQMVVMSWSNVGQLVDTIEKRLA